MYKKVFVIGSNSFSGSHYINYELSNSKKVIGISRSVENNLVMLPYKLNPNLHQFKFTIISIKFISET